MTTTQHTILSLLAERGPMTVIHIAETLDPWAWLLPVTGALTNLEGMNLVEERYRTWHITDAGREVRRREQP